MKGTVVFVMPMLLGHLNRTLVLAAVLKKMGYKVYYAGPRELIRFTLKNRHQLYELKTPPFDEKPDSAYDLTGLKKWAAVRQYHKNHDTFSTRKIELAAMLAKLQPTAVFLDEFYYSDLVCLFHMSVRVCIFQAKMGMYHNPLLPPPTYYALPSAMSGLLWQMLLLQAKWKNVLKWLKYEGYDKRSLVQKAMKREKLPDNILLNQQKLFTPSFTYVTELLLFPQEFDFPNEKTATWQHHLGPCIDLDRAEYTSDALKKWIEKKKATPDTYLIYCSLGTVSNQHLRKKLPKKRRFYQKIETLAKKYSNCFFVVATGSDTEQPIHTFEELPNLLWLGYAPQVYLLSEADVFYTHAGHNSVFEAIYKNVPMLLFPIDNGWEQNGTAARAVYHGIGIKADLTDSATKIWDKTQQLLSNNLYKANLKTMERQFVKTYSQAHLIEQLKKIGL